jgi:hypothetical protein
VQRLTATNAKWSNDGLVTFFNAKSSQAGHWIRAYSVAFKKHSRTCLPSLLGALRGSGGLLEFLWDADHQTLEEDVSTNQCAELHISTNYKERRRHLYVCSHCGMPIES